MFSLAALYVKENRLEQAGTLLADLLALNPGNEDAANLLEEVEHSLAVQKQVGG
jgi:hypothetical protein